jgi:hypothetical protein
LPLLVEQHEFYFLKAVLGGMDRYKAVLREIALILATQRFAEGVSAAQSVGVPACGFAHRPGALQSRPTANPCYFKEQMPIYLYYVGMQMQEFAPCCSQGTEGAGECLSGEWEEDFSD